MSTKTSPAAPGARRVAALLLSLDQAAAAALLKTLSPDVLPRVADAMTAIEGEGPDSAARSGIWRELVRELENGHVEHPRARDEEELGRRQPRALASAAESADDAPRAVRQRGEAAREREAEILARLHLELVGSEPEDLAQPPEEPRQRAGRRGLGEGQAEAVAVAEAQAERRRPAPREVPRGSLEEREQAAVEVGAGHVEELEPRPQARLGARVEEREEPPCLARPRDAAALGQEVVRGWPGEPDLGEVEPAERGDRGRLRREERHRLEVALALLAT